MLIRRNTFLIKTIFSRSFVGNIALHQKKYLSVEKKQDSEEIIESLNRQIAEYKIYLSRHSKSTYLGKKASSSLEILTRELSYLQQMSEPKAAPAIPCSISIEIVSNGTTHLRPCVVIHTNYKDYLFNCPEGTSRFLAANHLKAVNLSDIFFTRDTWENFAGLSGLLKTPIPSSSSKVRVIRLHGSHNKTLYFESQNDHNDADLPSTVTTKIDIAFLVELNPPRRPLDIQKIKELKIPAGPHMKKLKDGENITLSDGRFIKAEDVLGDVDTNPLNACLIVECSDIRKLSSLQNNTLLRNYNNRSKTLKYVLHFTGNSILNNDEYKSWMNSFGESVEHIIVNGSGPCLPHMEAMYRINVILNHICPKLFPPLYPQQFNGILRQDDDCEKSGNFLYARPFQRYFLRKPVHLDPSPPSVSLIRTDLLLQLKENLAASEAIDLFKRTCNMPENEDSWPRICFLGTSSAVPTSFRNVSAYLLQFDENSFILVDCGEGSYGQLRTLFGDIVCDDLLLKLRAVFITHGHQDHYQGIFTIVRHRKELFVNKGLTYKPLVVVGGSHVLKNFRGVDRSFGNFSESMHIVDISKILRTLHQQKGNPVEAVDLTGEMPFEIAGVENFGFKSVVAVKVNHARSAVGYIFNDMENRKFVFSGDTMPCERLVDYGKDALVLVHESTFADDEEAHALYKKHSTMKQAFDIATRMRAKNIVLTHFSAKYSKIPPLPDYIEKVGNVTIAMDNMIVTPSDLKLSAKLIPVLRTVFAKEISEIIRRSIKRHIEDDTLAQRFVDTLGSTMRKKKAPENLSDSALSITS